MIKITKDQFGKLPDGKNVFAYTMANDYVTAKILNYGGIIQSLIVDGKDVVCGYDTIEGYLNSPGYHGALIGRYANRIKGGTFTLDGTEYVLARNEQDRTHLHGGMVGFDKKIWKVAEAKADAKKITLVLELFSPDMEEGYPGNLNVKVTYTLSEKDFSIRYEAVSDKNTVLNLTNHAYFNMNGYDSKDSVETQTLGIFADTFTEIDNTLIPTGDASVEGTAFDFRTPKLIGKDIANDEPQINVASGYDHNFNFSGDDYISYMGKKLRYGAVMSGDTLTMHLYTDKPAVQFYVGHGIRPDDIPFKNNVPKSRCRGMCLETQFKPDSPNHGEARLEANEKYDYTTLFRFEF